MCDNCDNLNALEALRERLIAQMLKHPAPCVVCHCPVIVDVASWIPDEKHRLAVGAGKGRIPVLVCCVCADHAAQTEENNKLLMQAMLRSIREKKSREEK